MAHFEFLTIATVAIVLAVSFQQGVCVCEKIVVVIFFTEKKIEFVFQLQHRLFGAMIVIVKTILDVVTPSEKI